MESFTKVRYLSGEQDKHFGSNFTLASFIGLEESIEP